MNRTRKALYFFCMKEPLHIVGRDVFNKCRELYDMDESDLVVDGYPVLEYRDNSGNLFSFMRQKTLVSYEYDRFLPVLRRHFSDYTIAGEVNWHAGENAPDRILTVHSIGDVETGHFSPAAPQAMRSLLLSLEEHRKAGGLDDFTVTTEATHWTGSIKGGDPSKIPLFPVPMVDIEIGSARHSWENERAVECLARALTEVFQDEGELLNILCVGGTHFEDSFAQAALDRDHPFGVSHILPNQWLVSGGYETEEGYRKMKDCVDTIPGGIRGLFYHEGLKGPYRQTCRVLGEELGVPVFKHKKLRKPEGLPFWEE
ncbi:MAG TPA: D-aminoacyl-tRNA deacylase [Synergistales bacterium]|nr:D-aminoacyl-tRNA deacylase [Synergistales bacterium]